MLQGTAHTVILIVTEIDVHHFLFRFSLTRSQLYYLGGNMVGGAPTCLCKHGQTRLVCNHYFLEHLRNPDLRTLFLPDEERKEVKNYTNR